jgi:hypothetical protein
MRLLAIALFSSVCLLADAGPCGFRVTVTDAYGNRLGASQIRIMDGGSTSDVPQDAVFRSTCGQHTLNVTAPGFAPARVMVDLDQTDQIITVALRVGALEGTPPTCSVLGEITPPTGVVRIRLSQLFGVYTVDVPISKTNTFQINNIECGVYMLLVMGNQSCLGTRILTITAETGRVARVILKGEVLADMRCTTLNPKN